MKYNVIVSVKLGYTFEAENVDEAKVMAEKELYNIKFPKEYIKDSFEIVKVLDEDGNLRS